VFGWRHTTLLPKRAHLIAARSAVRHVRPLVWRLPRCAAPPGTAISGDPLRYSLAITDHHHRRAHARESPHVVVDHADKPHPVRMPPLRRNAAQPK
jgi:hypothetical protein